MLAPFIIVCDLLCGSFAFCLQSVVHQFSADVLLGLSAFVSTFGDYSFLHRTQDRLNW